MASRSANFMSLSPENQRETVAGWLSVASAIICWVTRGRCRDISARISPRSRSRCSRLLYGNFMGTVIRAVQQECKYSGGKTCRRVTIGDVPQASKTAPDQRERALVDVVRAAADEKDISQKAIAEHVGISPTQVSRIFSGQKPVTITELMAMMDVVGLDFVTVVRELGL